MVRIEGYIYTLRCVVMPHLHMLLVTPVGWDVGMLHGIHTLTAIVISSNKV